MTPWSEIIDGSTRRFWSTQSERVMRRSRIPPLLCVGESTCWVRPKEARSSVNCLAWISSGFSRCTFRFPHDYHPRIERSNTFKKEGELTKKHLIQMSWSRSVDSDDCDGPGEWGQRYAQEFERCLARNHIDFLHGELFTVVDDKATARRSPRCLVMSESIGREIPGGLDDIISLGDKTTDGDIVSTRVATLTNHQDIQLPIENQFRYRKISELYVTSCWFFIEGRNCTTNQSAILINIQILHLGISMPMLPFMAVSLIITSNNSCPFSHWQNAWQVGSFLLKGEIA